MLTSFPYRIVYANRAYTKMTGKTSLDLMGESFYDLFLSEVDATPTMAACREPLSSYGDEEIVRLDVSLICQIRIRPVYNSPKCSSCDDVVKRTKTKRRRVQQYYAVVFDRIQITDDKPSLVYLPMPIGSMKV